MPSGKCISGNGLLDRRWARTAVLRQGGLAGGPQGFPSDRQARPMPVVCSDHVRSTGVSGPFGAFPLAEASHARATSLDRPARLLQVSK